MDPHGCRARTDAACCRRSTAAPPAGCLTRGALFQMDKLVFHAVDEFDGTQNVIEWVRELERASDFANWGEPTMLKVALIRLKGEASEFVSHLQEEGKVATWPELRAALKERYQTTRREQWHQFLLNTGQQEGKTVHEWAQLVRKLSLASLSPEDRQMGLAAAASRLESGRGEEQTATSRNGAAPKNPLLEYIRRTNFVRGLRPALRKAVWRRHCTTFDEAVAAAADEEALEVTTHQVEVLSSYRGAPSKEELIDTLVAAMEIRDERNRKKNGQAQNASAAPDNQPPPAERQNSATYPAQLPLPRQSMVQRQPEHYFRGAEGGQPMVQASRAPQGMRAPTSRRPWSEEEQAMYRAGACFICHERGHIARFCPRRVPGQQAGNERRRPL